MKLNRIDIDAIKAANGFIDELNEKRNVRISFDDITPDSLSLIHNRMRELNPNHQHYFSVIVSVNGQTYTMNPMDFDRIMLYHEYDNVFVQIYGWNHIGFIPGTSDMDAEGKWLRVSDCFFALSYSVIDREFLKKSAGTWYNPMMAPAAPNGFVDFNWNKINRAESYIDMDFPENMDAINGVIYIVMPDTDDVDYKTT